MSKPDRSPTVRHEGNGRSALRTVSTLTGEGRTLVIDHPRAGLHVPHRPPTQFELLRNTLRAVYTVDTAERQRQWTVELPSADDPCAFSVVLHATWQVTDPVEAVRSGLHDPGALCAAHVERQLRKVAARHRIEQSKGFNKQAGQLALVQKLSKGVSLLRCSVRAQPDAAARAHLDELKQRRRDRDLRTEDHHTVMHDRKLQLTEAQAQQRLDRQQAEHDGQLARLRNADQLQIEGDRMRFYQGALEGGIQNLLALQLASDRPEVRSVIELVMRQHQLTTEQAYGVINSLLESGTLNRSDLRDMPAYFAKVIADNGGGPLPGLPATLDVPAPRALPADTAPPSDRRTAAEDARMSARAERRRRDADRDARDDGGGR